MSLATSDDIFAEVGDRVTYCFMDKPEVKYTVWIVDGPGNPQRKMVNDNTPIAKALLGLSCGEENEIGLPGQQTKIIKLLKIEKA